MKRLPLILLAMGVIALAVVLTSLTTNRASAQACGPGNHWVDTCPAGTDNMPDTGALVGIDIDLDCVEDLSLVLRGPVDIDRSSPLDDSTNFPGTRPVDGHLDVIDTEIVSMTLTGGGVTLRVGVNTPGINPAVPNTFGAVAEQPADPALAESFFDVFFEVAGVPGGPVYNHTALRIDAAPPIEFVPPDTVYLHPSPLCLPLYDDPVAGTLLYNLVEANHDTRPPSVGGITELLPGGPETSVSSGGGSGSSVPYALVAGAAAAAALVLAAGGCWYARRRLS